MKDTATGRESAIFQSGTPGQVSSWIPMRVRAGCQLRPITR